MRIAIDIHGTIDEYPDIFKNIIGGLKNAGVEVWIISGPPKVEIIEELQKLGLFWEIELKNVISVVDWLKERGVKMWQDEKDTWWCEDDEWWSSKAKICEENNIKIMIDDSPRYKPFFDNVAFTFVHVNDIISKESEEKFVKITEKEHELLEAVIFDQYHDGREPVNDPVWVEHLDTDLTGRSKSGVISSLQKKGLVRSNKETIYITEEGMKAYDNSNLPKG